MKGTEKAILPVTQRGTTHNDSTVNRENLPLVSLAKTGHAGGSRLTESGSHGEAGSRKYSQRTGSWLRQGQLDDEPSFPIGDVVENDYKMKDSSFDPKEFCKIMIAIVGFVAFLIVIVLYASWDQNKLGFAKLHNETLRY